jgi:hypothetical protein
MIGGIFVWTFAVMLAALWIWIFWTDIKYRREKRKEDEVRRFVERYRKREKGGSP